mgnify:CR=1 FL=1
MVRVTTFNFLPVLLLFIAFSYFVIRNYFSKYITPNNKALNKRLSLLMTISGIISIFLLFAISYNYKVNNVKHFKNGSLISFLLSFDNLSKYEFRIVAIILFLIFIAGMIFLFIKNKNKLSIACMGIGLLANIMIYIDFLNFNWSRITDKKLEITTGGLIFLTIYLIIYILLIVREKTKKDIS